MISTLVIVGLVVVWAIVLLPDALAKASSVRKRDTIRSFNNQLSSLGRSAPVRREGAFTSSGRGPIRSNVIDLSARRARGTVSGSGSEVAAAPSGPTQPRPVSPTIRKRRQDVLFALGAAALLTLLATVAFGGLFLYLHLVADALMAAYLVALQRAGASSPVQVGSTPVGVTEPDLTPLHLRAGVGGRPDFATRSVQSRRIAN